LSGKTLRRDAGSILARCADGLRLAMQLTSAANGRGLRASIQDAKMAEAFNETTLPGEKAERYAVLAGEVAAVLKGEPNLTARLATVASMLAQAFDHFFWAGFYLVDREKPDELVVGPYQGTLGCLRIAFGRGVCGTAAAERRALIVPDVEAFPGHIACDSRARSEIVVPVFGPGGALLGVFDVDATELAAFDDIDAAGIERILAETFGV
jgi:L-methionine (R)-S-oxide reductase